MQIVISDLRKSYRTSRTNTIRVLRGVDLKLTSSEIVTMVGPNGSGKSTLLNVIAGLQSADAGKIEFRSSLKDKPQAGYVWQDYRASLLPWLTVEENISFPLRLAGESRHSRRQKARAVLDELRIGIKPNQYVYALSGGQQQLVSLLRSFIIRPDFFLLDEPFSALDQQTRWSLAAYVETIWNHNQVPTLMVSHDIDEAIMVADRILLLSAVSGSVALDLYNNLPRPRTVDMLTTETHISLRNHIIDFLTAENSSRN